MEVALHFPQSALRDVLTVAYGSLGREAPQGLMLLGSRPRGVGSSFPPCPFIFLTASEASWPLHAGQGQGCSSFVVVVGVFLLAAPLGTWNYSSPTRDPTGAPCSGSAEL